MVDDTCGVFAGKNILCVAVGRRFGIIVGKSAVKIVFGKKNIVG